MSIEDPGVDHQVSAFTVPASPFFGKATDVHVEDFNRASVAPPSNTSVILHDNGFDFGADNSGLGHYSAAVVRTADQFGGAKGTAYMTVNPKIIGNAPSETTITFNQQQRYFGLWWSAGDSFNDLQFFHGDQLLFKFTTADVIAFLNSPAQVARRAEYFGNPNSSPRENPNEPFAFLNFFAPPANEGVTFDKVVLINAPPAEIESGFESDNHTIATAFTEIGGEEIPTPGEPDPPIEPGPGEVVRLGPGTVALEHGTGHLGGTLDIDAGALLILTGDKIIDPPGDLEGGGDIMTPEVDNGGTVGPMGEEGTNTPGDLTVIGDYNQGPGGTLKIGIAGEQCPDGSRLVVTGTATLSGTLSLVSLNNAHATSGSHYTVLIAFRGINGFFSNVTDTFDTSGLTRADIAAPNGVVVAYLPSGHGVLTLRSAIAIPFDDPCDVDAVLLSALAPNAEQLAAPFDIWFSLAQQQRFNLENHFDDIMAAPVPIPAPAPPPAKQVIGKGVISGKEALPPAPEKRWNVWATGFGDWIDISSEGRAKGYNYTNGGGTFGVDYRLSDIFVLGAMGGYAHTWTDLRPGSVDINTGWGGLYFGLFNLKGFYLLGAAFGGGGSFDTSRADVLGGRANGSSDAQEWSSFLSAGYDFHCGQLTIGPLFSAQYSYVNMSGFTEHGSIADLSVREASQESWRTDLGFRAWYTFQFGSIGVRPFLRAAWNHEYKENGNPISVSLVDILGGAPVRVSGPSLGHDSAVVNAGASVQWTPTISTYVSYDGQLGRKNFDYNGVSGGFNITF